MKSFITACILTVALFGHDAFALIPFMFIPQSSYLAYNTWTGATSTDWSVGTNWSKGHQPISGETAYFDNTCTTCNVSITANTTVYDIKLGASYTGTITQNAGKTFNVNGNWEQLAGTFQGGDSAVNINAQFSMTGGTFNATTGLTTFNATTISVYGGTFNGGSGSILTYTPFNVANATLTAPSGGFTFYNTAFYFYAGVVFYHNNGVIELKRTILGTSYPTDLSGVAFYDLKLSSTATGGYSNVSLQNYLTVYHNLTLSSADPTYPINTYNQGYSVGGNVILQGYGGQSSNLIKLIGSAPVIDGSSATTPNSVGIQLGTSQTATWLNSPVIKGSFSCVSSTSITSNGNFSVLASGNFDCALTGNSTITFAGSSTTGVLAGAGTVAVSYVTINKTGGGSLSQTTNLSFVGSSNKLDVQAGTLFMSGKNLSVVGTLMVESGATITKGGGTLTYGSLAQSGTIN